MPALGPYNHTDGTGYVAPKRGNYWDAIEHRKAAVHVVCFEAGLGGMLPHAARRLRRNAREAKANGADPTDYTTSPMARSFVPYYAQRLSTACVLYGARGIQKSIKKRVGDRRKAATSE